MKKFVTVFVSALVMLSISIVIDGCQEAKKEGAPQDSVIHDTLQEEVEQDATDAADAAEQLDAADVVETSDASDTSDGAKVD